MLNMSHHYTCILWVITKLECDDCIKVFVLIFYRKNTKYYNLHMFIFPDFLSLLLSKSIVPSIVGFCFFLFPNRRQLCYVKKTEQNSG